MKLAQGQSVVVPKDESEDILKMLDYEKCHSMILMFSLIKNEYLYLVFYLI